MTQMRAPRQRGGCAPRSGPVPDPDVSFTRIDPGADRFQRLRQELGVTGGQPANESEAKTVLLALGGAGEHAGRDGRAWADWEEGGEGRPPQEVPLPEDLPAQ